mmetsp:Transcript_34018/g.106781  ORF Transcript_34018/g.106781 Transcript_34018/m.106781 type:complete len:144 (+) Transcript_34018:103-534(+)
MDADDISEGHQRKRAERQLDDGIAAMLDQYSQLLLCARVRGPVQQGADELSASVASSALLQSADGLLSVAEGLTFEALLFDGGDGGETARAVSVRERSAARDAERRLEAVRREAQAALRELEESYYSSARLLARGGGRDGGDE